MYQALYRKWRPQTFDDVVGQSHITQTLSRQIETGRLSHAYLFVGTRGTGKTTCAKILAKAANCEHPVNGNPCNKCPSCRGIDSGAILDVEELDAASNNGVDNIRALREEAVYTPASVRKRVYIIDEVHMLSTSAFNALLKILEEPPEHLIFILATTELNKVPATILSRCQRFSFKRITPQQIIGRIKYIAENENINITDEAAELIANLSDGAMRDALSLLDQCLGSEKVDADRVRNVVGLAGAGETASLMDSIIDGDAASCLKKLNDIYMEGKEISSIMKELLSLYRDTLILKIAKAGADRLFSGFYTADILKKVSSRVPANRLIRGQELLEESLSSLSRSSEAKIHCEMCLIMLCDETLMSGSAGLEARVSRLEAGAAVHSRNIGAAPPAREAADSSRISPEAGTEGKDDGKKAVMSDVPFDTEGARIVGTGRKATPPEPEKKAPEPAAEPAPESKKQMPAARPSSDGEGQWHDILAAVESRISKPPYTFLSSPIHCGVKIDGNILTIGTKSAIAKNLINANPVKLAIKEAAEAVLGRPVTVNVTDYDESEMGLQNGEGSGEDKLDSLKKFGNITFE